MHEILQDEFAILLTAATIAARDGCRVVDDYAHYTKLEKNKESAWGDAEELAQLLNEDAAERAKLTTRERRVETTA
ncbi:MAG: hypothetical protein ACR2OV_04925 [Hyphomicrobiaceae bacterium]